MIAGESSEPVIPYLALSAGWSFWPAGGSDTAASTELSTSAASAPDRRTAPEDPLDSHEGLLVSFSIGGGPAQVEGCDSCDLAPGLAFDGSLGWFLGRRVALMLDSTAMVALFSITSGFGSAGVGLSGPAVQYWPHSNIWLKLGVGVAQLSSVGIGGTGTGNEIGGGMTFAGGWDFHHSGSFHMDAHLRITHAGFEPVGGEFDGITTFVGLLGFSWY